MKKGEEEQLVDEERSRVEERREEGPLVEEQRGEKRGGGGDWTQVCRGRSIRRLIGIHVERLENTGELCGPCCQRLPQGPVVS